MFLHYVLDLWVNEWRKRHAKGEVMMIRYADDFVIGFREESDALKGLAALGERCAMFGLNLHPEKTRLIQFGRYAEERRAKRGQGHPRHSTFWALPILVEKPGEAISPSIAGRRERSSKRNSQI